MLFIWFTAVINHTAVYDVILDIITDVKMTGKMRHLFLSLVWDQIADMRSNSVLTFDLDQSLV